MAKIIMLLNDTMNSALCQIIFFGKFFVRFVMNITVVDDTDSFRVGGEFDLFVQALDSS